jgi:hypothetical protein
VNDAGLSRAPHAARLDLAQGNANQIRKNRPENGINVRVRYLGASAVALGQPGEFRRPY